MKNILVKLAEVATQLDEAGHKEQADKIDAVLQQLAAQLTSTADQGAPFMGGVNLSQEEREAMGLKPEAPATPIPQSVTGKIVMRSKTNEAAGFGFFGADQIKKAVKEGKVDQAVAVKAMQDYLQAQSYPNIGQTMDELISSLVGGAGFPIKGRQNPEIYGGKSFWQRMLGK
jgi:hypothetical protein